MGTDLYRSPCLPWLEPVGEESDVVLASRVRLARNLGKVPFPSRADVYQLAAVKKTASAALPSIEKAMGQMFDALDIDEIAPLERETLCAKYLISRNLAKEPEQRAAFISDDRSMSIMVNEEDHLRILCMAPGLNLDRPLDMAFRVDDVIGERLDMAFDEKLGYLTSWPTNLGTGLQCSVLLHLPGLVFTDNIGSIIHISQRLGLQMKSVFTSGNEAVGNLFRLSNQLSLGLSEQEILTNVRGAVVEIASHERRVRTALELHQKDLLEDYVWRAYGELSYARRMRSANALNLMSKLRLGIDLGIVDVAAPGFFPELIVANREGYLKNLAGKPDLSKEEIYRMRANIIRQTILRYTVPRRHRP